MAQENYIGINGLVTQELDEILTSLVTQFRSIYGQDINLEQNSPDGQWLNILAQEKKDILDLFTSYYNNLDPDRVVGIPQQILYKLNGLTINAYTYSYVYVTVNVSEDVTLQGLDDNIENADGTGYTVRDTNGNRWILAETQELSAGSYTLNFRSAELGSITALASTINIMETVKKGVTSVNNPAANYITGNQGETSAQFRQRRNRAMAVPSQGFEESLQSQMLNLPNVTQCKVYNNRKDTTEDDIPPHTTWVIVEGGSSDDIGRVIYNNLPPGIPMKGTQSVEITKQNGDIETVYYDLPLAVPLYIRATIQSFDAAPDEDYIKSQLAGALDYEIGQMAETANITTQLKEILSTGATAYNVEVSSDNVTWAEYLTPTGLNEFWSVAADNITLTVA
jgi:hypothetical protein